MKTIFYLLTLSAILVVAFWSYTEHVYNHAWYFSERFVKVVTILMVLSCIFMLIMMGVFIYSVINL